MFKSQIGYCPQFPTAREYNSLTLFYVKQLEDLCYTLVLEQTIRRNQSVSTTNSFQMFCHWRRSWIWIRCRHSRCCCIWFVFAVVVVILAVIIRLVYQQFMHLQTKQQSTTPTTRHMSSHAIWITVDDSPNLPTVYNAEIGFSQHTLRQTHLLTLFKIYDRPIDCVVICCCFVLVLVWRF